MSLLELSNFSFIKNIIREYYSKKPLEEPLYIHKREIALHSLEDNAYIRHLSFTSMNQLYNYILDKKTPLHLYYSSAYYENPSSDKMELKGWQGSDLMFDIDADKFKGCNKVLSICINNNIVYEGKIDNCPNDKKPLYFPLITNECIDRAFYDAYKLYHILREEFGFKNIKVYFSGNRGFHVKVYDEDALTLTSDERREIASYVSLEGFKLERIIPSGSSKKYIYFTRREYGVRKRIVKAAYKLGIKVKEYDDYIAIPANTIDTLLNEVRIKIDPVVTMDVSRLSRFGLSLNCKSGLMVYPINIDAYKEFSYKHFSPWEGGIIVKPLIDAELIVYSEKIRLRRGEPIYLEAPLALYLILKNIVKIVDTRDFGVKKCMTCF
ncbi:MAG: DNA primase [Desulfurococcales archaeon ex4484_58]|nr:MAG: DNA primase [Desulfurococcales archaeon ex4484_58]